MTDVDVVVVVRRGGGHRRRQISPDHPSELWETSDGGKVRRAQSRSQESSQRPQRSSADVGRPASPRTRGEGRGTEEDLLSLLPRHHLTTSPLLTSSATALILRLSCRYGSDLVCTHCPAVPLPHRTSDPLKSCSFSDLALLSIALLQSPPRACPLAFLLPFLYPQ